MSSGAWSALIFLVFSLLYLGQALLARFVIAQTWIGRALLFANQWLAVAVVAGICGAAAAYVKMSYFSEGHFGTSISGLAWSGPPANEGVVFAIAAGLVFAVAGYALHRSPRPSIVSDVALFLVPAACVVGGAIVLALLIADG